MIRIRDFGNDTICTDAADVLTSIQQYKGRSVTVHDTRIGGKMLYVDVLPSGLIRSTYGDQRLLDLNIELQTAPSD